MEEIFTIPFKINFVLDEILLFISSLALLITCFWLIISRNLIESIIILSVFSLLIGLCYLFMDAPDVAMTETALGACLSTCVLLNVAKIVGEDAGKLKKLNTLFAIILCTFFIVILTWISLDLPSFGTQDSEVQTHLTKYYLQNTRTDIAIPSFVAAILASYRGYDTLGETIVILIASLAVLVIVSRKKNNA
jgi:multicomponent Na+:H+ antiporter subunit B